MKSLILGATGFIGTNLSIRLAKENENIALVGKVFSEKYYNLFKSNLSKVTFVEEKISSNTDFGELIDGVDIIYHLICSCVPANSNNDIENNILCDLQMTIRLLDSAVKKGCKKIIFISSGGAIYGNSKEKKIDELSYTSPITAYGIQKLAIEKVLYLYNYLYGLDYKIIRLGNPYGTFQNANKGQGVISTLVYSAIKDKIFTVYGDGTNERDYIYIDDAINSIMNISKNKTKYNVYNVGSGIGVSINCIIDIVSKILNKNIKVEYIGSRSSDVKNIHLNIDRYKNEFGNPINIELNEGIKRTIDFIRKNNVE